MYLILLLNKKNIVGWCLDKTNILPQTFCLWGSSMVCIYTEGRRKTEKHNKCQPNKGSLN